MKMISEKDLIELISANDIQKKIEEIGAELNLFFGEEELQVVCVLRGAAMFTVDLVKQLKMPLRMEFIKVSSYGSGFASSGTVTPVDLDLADLDGKNVLIVEDIIDTGNTAKFLLDYIKNNYNPKTLKFCALVDKKCKRKVDVDADFYGFEVEDKFLVGYGLDYNGYYRNLPYIGYVKEV